MNYPIWTGQIKNTLKVTLWTIFMGLTSMHASLADEQVFSRARMSQIQGISLTGPGTGLAQIHSACKTQLESVILTSRGYIGGEALTSCIVNNPCGGPSQTTCETYTLTRPARGTQTLRATPRSTPTAPARSPNQRCATGVADMDSIQSSCRRVCLTTNTNLRSSMGCAANELPYYCVTNARTCRQQGDPWNRNTVVEYIKNARANSTASYQTLRTQLQTPFAEDRSAPLHNYRTIASIRLGLENSSDEGCGTPSRMSSSACESRLIDCQVKLNGQSVYAASLELCNDRGPFYMGATCANDPGPSRSGSQNNLRTLENSCYVLRARQIDSSSGANERPLTRAQINRILATGSYEEGSPVDVHPNGGLRHDSSSGLNLEANRTQPTTTETSSASIEAHCFNPMATGADAHHPNQTPECTQSRSRVCFNNNPDFIRQSGCEAGQIPFVCPAIPATGTASCPTGPNWPTSTVRSYTGITAGEGATGIQTFLQEVQTQTSEVASFAIPAAIPAVSTSGSGASGTGSVTTSSTSQTGQVDPCARSTNQACELDASDWTTFDSQLTTASTEISNRISTARQSLARVEEQYLRYASSPDRDKLNQIQQLVNTRCADSQNRTASQSNCLNNQFQQMRSIQTGIENSLGFALVELCVRGDSVRDIPERFQSREMSLATLNNLGCEGLSTTQCNCISEIEQKTVPRSADYADGYLLSDLRTRYGRSLGRALRHGDTEDRFREFVAARVLAERARREALFREIWYLKGIAGQKLRARDAQGFREAILAVSNKISEIEGVSAGYSLYAIRDRIAVKCGNATDVSPSIPSLECAAINGTTTPTPAAPAAGAPTADGAPVTAPPAAP